MVNISDRVITILVAPNIRRVPNLRHYDNIPTRVNHCVGEARAYHLEHVSSRRLHERSPAVVLCEK